MTTDPAHGKDQTTVTVTHTEDGLTVIDEIITYPLKPLAIPSCLRLHFDKLCTVIQLPYRDTDLLKRLRERNE